MKNYSKYGKGWYRESERHSLAAKGIKTGRKMNYAIFPRYDVTPILGKKKKSKEPKMSFWVKRHRKQKLASYPYVTPDTEITLHKEGKHVIIEKVTHANGDVWYNILQKWGWGRDVEREENLTKKRAESLLKNYDEFYEKQGEKVEW